MIGCTNRAVDGGQLVSVSCSSAAFCVSVGYLFNCTLAEKWNGKYWAGGQMGDCSSAAYLTGISCVPSRTYEAVGTTGAATLAEVYRG